MKIYTVEYVHVIERTVTVTVEASSEAEAIQKAQDGDILDSDEDNAPEDSIETKDYVVIDEE